ncbi:MAG: hypothetical protein AAF567_13975 [Actinomycetota bacterium]
MTRAPQRWRAPFRWALRILGRALARPIRFGYRLLRLLPGRLRERRIFVLGPLGLLALVGLMKVRGGEPPPPLEPFEPLDSGSLAIVAPNALGAGEPITVRVNGEFTDGEEVTLLVESTYAHARLDERAANGIAVFAIEGDDAPASGVVTLTAIAGERTGHGSIAVLPGPAVDPLELFLGPRTIEATNDTATMIVVLAQDEFGNPVAEGTPVEVRVTRPDLQSQAFVISTEGLVAWSRIISETLAGRSKVAVTVDEGRGKELDFLEVAGSPDDFLLELVDPPVPADGRSLVRLRTTQLIDEYGNTLPDGVTVFADVNGPGGIRRLHSQVIKGVAEFTLEAPSRPGTESVIVHASGTLSPPLLVPFGPMVTGYDVRASTDIDGVRISVGPIVSTLGAYIPDGTPVVVSSEFGAREYPSFNGEADIIIPATSDPITVDVLGFERTVQVGP